MSSTERFCGTCKFFTAGECRRQPPNVVAEVHSKTTGSAGDYITEIETFVVTRFPEVDGGVDWCGEFQPAPTPSAPIAPLP